MRKQVLYGKDAREKVLAGVNKIADAVVTTLGPLGRNVLIAQSMVVDYGVHNLPLHITKDGYTVTKGFHLDEPFEQAGALMAKECAQKSVDQAGDGTTTTILLMREIVVEGIKLINEGANPIELKRKIDKEVEVIVGQLKSMAVPIKGNIEKIRQIATVSANNDAEIGNWIAQAFEKIGDEGVIDLEASNGVSTELKLTDGYKFGRGWISPLFVNNRDKLLCEFENPLILLYDKRIIHYTQVERALTIATQQGKPLLIICEDADEQGLAYLAMNTAQGRFRCCAVKAPSFGDGRRDEMEDIALLTGGTYISDIKGVNIKEISLNEFGRAKKVIISKDETIIIGGEADAGAVEAFKNELRMNLTQVKTEDEKSPIEKRIARMSGAIAVIQVGAATETEMKEKLDRFDDSVRATKAALSEGYVPGGGTAFIRCIRKGISIDIEALRRFSMGADEVVKIYNETGNLVCEAKEIESRYGFMSQVLLKPLIQICKNAAVDNIEEIVKIVISAGGSVGYNVKSGLVEDLVESGIIDPVKVLRCAIQNAASSATMILTSECLIVDTL